MGSGGGKLASNNGGIKKVSHAVKVSNQNHERKSTGPSTPNTDKNSKASSLPTTPKQQQNGIGQVHQNGLEKESSKDNKEIDKVVVIFREKTKMQTSKVTSSVVTSESVMGMVSMKIPSTAKIVRIFTSSTFTDTKFERNMLMSDAYPVLKTFCQELGYEFQVVDMRWGVRDDAMDDHSTTDLCLHELKLCQEYSTGPNFVCLLSHKYGYTPLPREIDAKEFESIFNAMEECDGKTYIKKWYQRDDNAVPPLYILSPISTNYPDYVCNDIDRKNEAKSQWWKESDAMQDMIETTAIKVLGPEDAKKYIISVTEKEVQMGLLSVPDANKHCLWFRRTIKDIEKQKAERLLSRYIECLGDDEKWKKSRQLLKELEEDKMCKHLQKSNICSYTVNWTGKGIDPEYPDHQKYLKTMTQDFVNTMRNMIKAGIKERVKTEITAPLYTEYLQHIRFCQEKCANFHGRENTLSKLKTYIKAQSSLPLVVHGESGCGKTSLLAMAAKLMPEWMSNTQPAVVIRFIGTTPDSSNINGLLVNIIKQIKIIYGYEDDIPSEKPSHPTEDTSQFTNLMELSKEYEYVLGYAKPSQPLVLILDSLDQMDTAYNARSLFWIPRRIPPNVKIILSSLEDDVYECFPKLKAMYPDTDNFVSVPHLKKEDVENIVDKWLASRKRTLTNGQRDLLVRSFDCCPLPLFLKLSFDEACRWRSYSKPESVFLEQTVKASIENLFARLETHHGEVFVSRALGYLTAARSGLSESELEDVLSCDDDVLNDVYMFWTPPMRRLPPLLLVRLRGDLQNYIAERGADGIRVMYWYHRQFIETAKARYCRNDLMGILHTALAEFFSGTWREGVKKPYNDNAGQTDEADRHVAAQPMQHGDSYNVRKMNNLPYHWSLSGKADKLKEECLANYTFIQTKLIATSVRHVLDDYMFACKLFKSDKELEAIGSAIALAQEALIYDPLQLTPQLLDRLAGEKNLQNFLTQCRSCPVPYLMPDQEMLMKPGGQLIHCMSGHQGFVRGLDLKKDGKTAVTCSEDDEEQSVKTWDIIEGRLLKSYDALGKNPTQVKFILNDKLILAEYTGALKAIQQTGEVSYSIRYSGGGVLALAGPNKNWLGIFKGKSANIYNLENGKLLDTVKHHDDAKRLKFSEDQQNCVAESQNYAIATDNHQRHFTLYTYKTKKFGPWIEIFKKEKDDGLQKEIDNVVLLPNEKTFILSSVSDNSLLFYDRATMSQTRVIPGFTRDFCLDYKVTPDGEHLYCRSNDQIVVWNLAKGERSAGMPHPSMLIQVMCASGRYMVTTSEDTIVRVWDLERKDNKPTNASEALGHSVRHFQPLLNSRYVAVLVQGDRNKYHEGHLQVYDIATQSVVRQAEVSALPGIMKTVSDKHVLLGTRQRKIKIVNTDTMKVDTVCVGVMSKFATDVYVIKDGKELVANTRGRMHFKTYDVKTGKTIGFLKQPQSTTMKRFEDEFYVNEKGTILAAHIPNRSWFVFDLVKYQCLKEITTNDANFRHCGSYFGGLSYDGSRLAFSAMYKFDHPNKTLTADDISACVIWDTRKGKISDSVDIEKHIAYYESDNKDKQDGVFVEKCMILDETRLLTTHYDYIMRVWDFKTGQLLHRLEGHTSSMEVITNAASPYFLSTSNSDGDNSIRIWSKATLECLTSFRLDEPSIRLHMCTDGHSFVSSTKSPASRLVHWKLHGFQSEVNMKSHPEIFTGKSCNLTLELDVEADEYEEPEDPDSDKDEKDDEDDDDHEMSDVDDDDFGDDEDEDNDDVDELDDDDNDDYDDDEDDDDDDYDSLSLK